MITNKHLVSFVIARISGTLLILQDVYCLDSFVVRTVELIIIVKIVFLSRIFLYTIKLKVILDKETV